MCHITLCGMLDFFHVTKRRRRRVTGMVELKASTYAETLELFKKNDCIA